MHVHGEVELMGRSTTDNGKVTLVANVETVVSFPSTPNLIVHNLGPDDVYINFDATVTISNFKLESGSSMSGFKVSSLHLLNPLGAPTVQYIGG